MREICVLCSGLRTIGLASVFVFFVAVIPATCIMFAMLSISAGIVAVSTTTYEHVRGFAFSGSPAMWNTGSWLQKEQRCRVYKQLRKARCLRAQ